jgi:hypothetical protein
MPGCDAGCSSRPGIRFGWPCLGSSAVARGCGICSVQRFAIRHHAALTEAICLQLRRRPSDSWCRSIFLQVDIAALCGAIRDWTIAQAPGEAAVLDQLVCGGKTLRGSIEPTPGGSLAFIAQVTLYSVAPSARKVDASPSRPLQPPGGLMEATDASLQRGRLASGFCEAVG